MARAVAASAEAARARCQALRAAGVALKARRIDEIVSALDAACARWRDPSGPERRAAEPALADRYGVPERAIATVLDAAFGGWDAAALREWLTAELGRPDALDEPVPIGPARRLAIGPDLIVALSAHGVPTTPVTDVLAALLVKAPIWVKPASGADDLAARFARTLADVDPALGSAVEAAGWGSDSPAARGILASADVVVATGRGETIAALREGLGPEARLVVHGPRISGAIVTREALSDDRDGVIGRLADDVAFAGQMGCLSPVVAYVEAAAGDTEALVEPLQHACAERWPAPPRTNEEPAARARFAEWLALAAVERAAGLSGPVAGGFDEAWSVQARSRAAPPDPPPILRVLVLAPVSSADEAVDLYARRRGLVAAVGLAASGRRAAALAPALARAGVERVAPLGAMQQPPLTWRRDGRPTLAGLVRWFDWES